VYCKRDVVRQCLQYKSVNTETISGEKIIYVDFMDLFWCYTEAGTKCSNHKVTDNNFVCKHLLPGLIFLISIYTAILIECEM
jgi:hypothetical protein